MSELTAETINAVLASARLLKASGKKLTGYALCTDDNLSTLFHIASDIPIGAARWELPVDWSVRSPAARPLFTALGEELARQRDVAASQHALAMHIRRAFWSLVAALQQTRRTLLEELGTTDLLLLVTSTDPSRWHSKLAIAAARELNSDAMFRVWTTAMGHSPAEVADAIATARDHT